MPHTRRQIYRRRRIAVLAGTALVLGVATYLPFTLLAPLDPAEAVVETHAFELVDTPVEFPSYGASGFGAVGYGGVLASGGAPDARPIASISKVVTALVVLDAHPLVGDEPGPTITFSEIDEDFYAEQLANDSYLEPAIAGTTISQRNMLDAMLMASANNYAQSLATWAFGSESAYVEAAANWLAAHALTNTTILDASGINPGNVSTVEDLVRLGELAVASPIVSAISATPVVEIPGIGQVGNRNGLLGIDGIDGIKTGTLDEAGSCLLFSADFVVAGETITIVGVVLGGPDRDTINAAIREILAQARAGFQVVTLATPDEQFATYSTPWGDTAAAVPAEQTSVVKWASTPVEATVELEPVTLASRDDDVGDLVFTIGGRTVSVDLRLTSTISDPGPWWRLSHPQLLF